LGDEQLFAGFRNMPATRNLFENLQLSQGNCHAQSFMNNTDDYCKNNELLFIIKKIYPASSKSQQSNFINHLSSSLRKINARLAAAGLTTLQDE
jgi:hypothetical protein